MPRLPDNATAMRLRKSGTVPSIKTYPYRLTSASGVQFDVLAPNEDAARLYVQRRHQRIRIESVTLAGSDQSQDSKRLG
ncbi:hypothetical protein [Rhizobium sp. NFR03]|uniref:hypothetical protein n=1 Tax=Rhizobium sp. NFR03 TaxID=1566263 RepID=UPI0008D41A94|nr:hypothetical protein [Rhizobium sp. NFR03]SER58259.1 hypothetical protein SAMN03159406_00567 [Rhizobium sp. NFR03]